MKFNIFQKGILIAFSIALIYFSIIHVPFKIEGSTKLRYDTIFSNSTNLDFGRLSVVVLVLAILTLIFLVLSKNVNGNILKKVFYHNKIFWISVFSVMALLSIFIILSVGKSDGVKKTDSLLGQDTVVDAPPVADTLIGSDEIVDLSEKRKIICNPEQALRDFKSYMEFYYPDWKIYGKPVVQDFSNCSYRVQFKTLNPYLKFEKEIMIAEISYNYNYTEYNFRIIRGNLY